MSAVTTANKRRSLRKRANFTAEVIDTISGQPIGHLGNLSATGVLLIGSQPPRKDGLYQFRFPLHGFDHQPQHIELGVQAQWHSRASSPGQVWAGYRIIAISQTDAAVLEGWLKLPL